MENKNNSDKLTFYLECSKSFIREKETEVHQSEQRIRFFIGFITGVLAFIGILNKTSMNNDNVFWLASVSLVILIVYGLLTFSQVIWSSHIISNLDITIGILKDLIKECEPVFKSRIEASNLRTEAERKVITHLKGTFAQYMYLTEGLLIGGLIFLIGTKFFEDQYFIITCFAILFFLMTITIMFKWGRFVKKGREINSIK